MARLVVAFSCVAALAVSAQGLPGMGALSKAAPPPAAPAASQPSAAEWTARLESAREEHRKLLDQAAGSAPLLGERQMASARRLVLLADSVEGLRDADAAGSKPADPASAPVKKLDGSPPFSVIDLDALRDRLDVLGSQQTALQTAIRALDSTIESAVQARREAEANLRLRREQASGRTLAGAKDDAQAQLELAELLAEVTELEVVQADKARQRARDRLVVVEEGVAGLQAELTRAGTQARLDDADLSKVLKGIVVERERLGTDGAKFAERLSRRDVRSTTAGEAWRGRMSTPLHRSLQLHGEIEAQLRAQENLWRGRQIALSTTVEDSQRQSVAQRLVRLAEELQNRQERLAEEERLLRSELRVQQALVDGLTAFDPTRSGEEQVLNAQKTQLDVQDRLRDTLERTQVLMQRLRVELGIAGKPADASERLERVGDWLLRWAITVWQYELFSATETTQIDGRTVTVDHGVTVGKSIGMLLVLVFGYWASGWLARLLIAGVGRSVPMSGPLARVLTRWVGSILLVVVVLLTLKLARIPLTAFAFVGGALAIGFGFGAQNVIKNLISGVIILFERKIRVGDIVTIGGMSGTVTTVDLRATTVRGFDGIDAIVPNSTLLENQLNNWSGSPDMRRTIAVGVAYGSDIRKAAELILQCAMTNPDVLPRHPLPPDVLFEDFGADSLLLRLRYWTKVNGPKGGSTVDSDLRFAIHDVLFEAGIEIAFPQRDVHLNAAAPLRVELIAAAAERSPATPPPR